jgi:hypothetical protein
LALVEESCLVEVIIGDPTIGPHTWTPLFNNQQHLFRTASILMGHTHGVSVQYMALPSHHALTSLQPAGQIMSAMSLCGSSTPPQKPLSPSRHGQGQDCLTALFQLVVEAELDVALLDEIMRIGSTQYLSTTGSPFAAARRVNMSAFLCG